MRLKDARQKEERRLQDRRGKGSRRQMVKRNECGGMRKGGRKRF